MASESPAVRNVGAMDTSTLLIVVGLTMGWLFGLIGGIAFDSGDDGQALFFSLSAIGGTTAALLLAARHLALGLQLSAVGFAFFAVLGVAGSVAGYTGPGPENVLGSLAVLHLPALTLIALQDWSPMWARAAAVISGVFFAIVGYDFVFGTDAVFDTDSALLIIAYLATTVAAIGWTLTVYNESSSASRPLS